MGHGRGDPIGSFTFSSQQRLRHKAEFDRAYQSGRRFHQSLFQAIVCPNDAGHARLGLSVAAKAVGNAVSRNRIRRLVREIFRHRYAELPAVDLVISARSQARTATNAAICADLERLLTTVRDRCAASSSPSSLSTGG